MDRPLGFPTRGYARSYVARSPAAPTHPANAVPTASQSRYRSRSWCRVPRLTTVLGGFLPDSARKPPRL